MAYFDGWLIFAIRWFYLIFCFSPTIIKNRCCSPVLDRKRDWIFYCYCCCFQLPFWSTGNLPSSPTRPLQPDHRLSSSVLPATLYPFGLESNADGGDRWTASSLSSSLSLHRIYVATQCRRCSCLLVVGDLFWLFFFLQSCLPFLQCSLGTARFSDAAVIVAHSCAAVCTLHLIDLAVAARKSGRDCNSRTSISWLFISQRRIHYVQNSCLSLPDFIFHSTSLYFSN